MLDPLNEDAYRTLMRLHALRGERATALHVYHACVTLLQRKLGVEPDVATRAAYERLLEAEASSQPPPAQPAMHPLIGRHREWATSRR